MKRIVIVFISLLALSFTSCSNMTIGLEEDSRFYDGPIYDNREDVKTKDELSTVSNKKKSINSETEVKTLVEAQEATDVSSQNETTFSYERDSE